MKKSRVFAFFTALVLTAGLLALPASAAQGEDFVSYACDPSVSAGGSAVVAGMHVEAGAAILVDVDHGQVLYAQNAHARMYPASITKIMTTLLTLEAVDRGQLSLEQVVTASENLHTGIGEGASNADIRVGEQMRIIDLLYSAMLPSANEACNVLAEAVSGSVASFVALMNQRAEMLGMADTHFSNTHGYHDDDHYTSAYDIALMSREAMDHELFRTMAAAASYTLPATNEHEQRVIRSTNALISNWSIPGYIYPYATGVKTGSTIEARFCLASAAGKNGRNLIAVVLGAENPTVDNARQRLQFSESIRLLDWGFDNFAHHAILDDTRLDIAEVEVTLSSEANYVAVRPEGSLSAVLPHDLDPAGFTYTPVLDSRSIAAPVEEGQVLGSIHISYEGRDFGTVDLVAATSLERSQWLVFLDQVQRIFGLLWVKLLLLAVILVALFLALRRAIFGPSRPRRRRRSRRERTYSAAYRGRR